MNKKSTNNTLDNINELLDAPILIDIERMDKALKSPRYLMPSGLSREERMAFILSKVPKDRNNAT